MNDLTKAIEEAMRDLSRWEYVNYAFIDIPMRKSSIALKDKTTGIVLEVSEACIFYRGKDLNIDKKYLLGFLYDLDDYHLGRLLPNLYEAYGVEE